MLSREQAAAQLLYRKNLLENLLSWAEHFGKSRGWVPAKHHRLLLEKLQAVTDGKLVHSQTGKLCKNLIILMPPGAAKSSYTSIVFPIWYLQRAIANGVHNPRILACSYSADLIENFSRQCRDGIATFSKELGFNVKKDSRAVQEWGTTNGANYRCLGVTAGLSGWRYDCGFIDDYLGSQEDADSKLIRDKQWLWLIADFIPRGKPESVRIIVANRRHEEDLVGRILDEKNSYGCPVPSSEWEVIKLPYFAEENDLLGRPVGERFWKDYFNEKDAEGLRLLPARIFAGLYQQRPAPEEGDFFQASWLREYSQDDYDKLMRSNPRIYGAGDWAVSTAKGSNSTCFGGGALDEDNNLYILPDLFWKVAGPKEVVQAFMEFLKRRNPLQFRSEKGHISQSWGPFFRDMMMQEKVYSYIEEVSPARDKETRAQSFRGYCSMGKVRFPAFAHWWSRAKHDLLTFPGGKEDDVVDFMAHLGQLVVDMIKNRPATSATRSEGLPSFNPTLSWLKEEDNKRKRRLAVAYSDR